MVRGLTEDAVMITRTRQLDSTTESQFTSLLYGDGDVVSVFVTRRNERCVASEAGDGAQAARERHLGGEGFTENERAKAQGIAAHRNVEFERGEVTMECSQAELEQAIKRVVLASQEIEAAAERWR